MIKFNGCLDAKEIGESCGRSVWRLNTSLIWTNGDKVVEVPPGFETDLASVPRLPFIYLMWGDRAHREAVLHDYLYRVGSQIRLSSILMIGIPKEEADWMFREAMIGQGVSWYIYHPMYLAVRCAGSSSFNKRKTTDKIPLDVCYE